MYSSLSTSHIPRCALLTSTAHRGHSGNCVAVIYRLQRARTAMTSFPLTSPQLSEHFAAAELDPLASTWDRIYDFTPREGSPNYKVVIPDDFAFQEIPLSPELGPCECPVPGPSGQRYGAADAAELQQSDIQGQPMSANEEGHLEPVEGFGNFDAALAQGGDDFTGFEDAQPAQADPAAFGQSEEEDAAPEQVDPAFEDFGAPADAGAYDRDGGVIALGAGEDAGAGSMDMLGMGMGEAPEEDGRGHFADASGEHFAEPFAEPAPEGAAFGAGGMANGFEVEDNAYVPPAAQQVETEAEEPQQFSFLAELEVRERQERLDALDSERERRGKV